MVGIENNAESWFRNEEPYTAKDRTILMKQLAGETWNVLSTSKYAKLHCRCWMKIGCLVTTDGSEDHLLKL